MKLKASGFDDCEEMREGELRPKRPGVMTRLYSSASVVLENRALYYEIVSRNIQETPFTTSQEKQILTMYVEGFTNEEIKKRLEPPVSRWTVQRKIGKWLRVWGLR